MEEAWSRDIILRINADVRWETLDACRFLNHRNVCITARITHVIETLLALRKFRKSMLNNILQRDIVILIAKCLRATSFDPTSWWDNNAETSTENLFIFIFVFSCFFLVVFFNFF